MVTLPLPWSDVNVFPSTRAAIAPLSHHALVTRCVTGAHREHGHQQSNCPHLERLAPCGRRNGRTDAPNSGRTPTFGMADRHQGTMQFRSSARNVNGIWRGRAWNRLLFRVSRQTPRQRWWAMTCPVCIRTLQANQFALKTTQTAKSFEARHSDYVRRSLRFMTSGS
jgi:hypothetical protein